MSTPGVGRHLAGPLEVNIVRDLTFVRQINPVALEDVLHLELLVDQSPEGLEVLRGSSTYVYDGNWKLQTENGADGYHVSTVHWNYVATTERRKQAAQPDNVRAMRVTGFGKQGGGFHSFENGHLLAWANWPNPEDRPNWEQRGKWAAQFGEARADWMVGRLRNLCLYPNVYLMDQMSSQIRQSRPIAVGCRSGSATPTSPPPASTITARRARRTVRRSK
jgi:phenylpropionate dioxygenase-like ring-hydroxylating dioxygenase large terminal subunit